MGQSWGRRESLQQAVDLFLQAQGTGPGGRSMVNVNLQ